VNTHLITKEQAEVLRAALLERRELECPLGALVGGLLCNTIYKLQRRAKPFKPTLRNRIAARLSDGYASVLAFILWVGSENVTVWTAPTTGTGKFFFHVRVKPNKELKCGPTGPGAASFDRYLVTISRWMQSHGECF